MAPLMKKSERWQALEQQAESQEEARRVGPRELLISYARQNGLPAKEVVYEDSACGRGPRLLVSVSSVSTLRGLCEHEHAKHDQVVQKLNHCRTAYYKELRWLRDQLHLAYRDDDEANARKAMMKKEDFNVFFFDQKNYVEPDSKESVISALEEEVHRLTEVNSELTDELERQQRLNSVKASLREHMRQSLLDFGVESTLHEMRGLLKSPGEQKTFARVAKEICGELEVEAPPEVAPEVGPSPQEQEMESLREELEKVRGHLIEVNARMVQEKVNMSVKAHDLAVQSERAAAEQKRADQAEEREKSLKRQFSELCQELTTTAEERFATAHRSVSRLEEVSQALASFKTPTAPSPAPSAAPSPSGQNFRLSATVSVAAAAQVADGAAQAEASSPKRSTKNHLKGSLGSTAGSLAAGSARRAVSRAVSTISAMSRVASAMSQGSFRSSDGFERREVMQTMQQLYSDLDATIGRGDSAAVHLEALSKDVLSELARLRESVKSTAEEAETRRQRAKEDLAAARAEIEGLLAEVGTKKAEVEQLQTELSRWKEGAPIAPNQATVNFLNRELNGLQQKERVQQDYIEELQQQLQTELANHQQKDGEQINTIGKLQASLEQMHDEIDQWQEKDTKTQIEIDELRAAIAEMKVKHRLELKSWQRKALKDAAEKEAELGEPSALEQQVRDKQVAINVLQEELELRQQEASNYEEQGGEGEKEIQGKQLTIDRLHARVDHLQAKLDHWQQKASSYERQLQVYANAEELAVEKTIADNLDTNTGHLQAELEHPQTNKAFERQATIDKLHIQINHLQAELNDRQLKESSHAKEIAADAGDYSSLSILEQEVCSKQATIEQLHAKVGSLQAELEYWQSKASAHQQQRSDATDKLDQSSQRMEEVREKQETIDNLHAKVEHLQGELDHWKLNASSHAQMMGAATEELEQSSQRMLQELRDKQASIDDLRAKVDHLQAELAYWQSRASGHAQQTGAAAEELDQGSESMLQGSESMLEQEVRTKQATIDKLHVKVVRLHARVAELQRGRRAPGSEGTTEDGDGEEEDVEVPDPYYKLANRDSEKKQRWQMLAEDGPNSRLRREAEREAELRRLPSHDRDVSAAFRFIEDVMQHFHGHDAPRDSVDDGPRGRSISKDRRSFSKDRRSFSKDPRSLSNDRRRFSKDVRSLSKDARVFSKDASAAGQPRLERRRTTITAQLTGMSKAGHQDSLGHPHGDSVGKPPAVAGDPCSSVLPVGTANPSKHFVDQSHPDVGSSGPSPVPVDEGAGPDRGSPGEEPRSDSSRVVPFRREAEEPSASVPGRGPLTVNSRERRHQRNSVPNLDLGHGVGAAPSQGGLRPSSLDKLRAAGYKPGAAHVEPELSRPGLTENGGGSQRRDRRAEPQGTHRHLRAEPPPFRTGVTTPEGLREPGWRGGGGTPRREAPKGFGQQYAHQPLLGESVQQEAGQQPKQSEWDFDSRQGTSETRDQMVRDVAPPVPAASGGEPANEVARHSKPPRLLRARTEGHLSARLPHRVLAADLHEQREQVRGLLNSATRGRQGSNTPQRLQYPIRTISEAFREEAPRGPSIVRSRSENFETRGHALTMTPRKPRERSPVRARQRSREDVHRAEAVAEPAAAGATPNTGNFVGGGHAPEDVRDGRVACMNGMPIPRALVAVFERSLSQEREQREARFDHHAPLALPTTVLDGPTNHSGYPRGALQGEQADEKTSTSVGASRRYPTVTEPPSPGRSFPLDAYRSFPRNKLEPLELATRGLSPSTPQPRGTVLAALKTPARVPAVPPVPSPPARPSPTARDTAREMAAHEVDASGQRRARNGNAGFAARIRELSGGRWMTYKELQQRQQPFTNMGAASTRLQRGPQARSAPTLNPAETRSEHSSAGFLPTLSSPSAALLRKGHKP